VGLQNMKNPGVIVITGASSGIGEALAYAYAKDGVSLHLAGRHKNRLIRVHQNCEVKGAKVFSKIIDVTDRESMRDWLADIKEIDLIVVNAGISGGTSGVMSGEPLSQARSIFDVNLMGVLNTIEPVINQMIERGRGQIALMSSLAGYRGWPTAPAYSASKGAVRFYGEALRGSIRRTGVEVNVICPGFVQSPMTDRNDFPMPFKMSADKAAQIIKKNLEKNKGRISFPWPVVFVSWFLSILPDCMAQYLVTRFPAKKAL